MPLWSRLLNVFRSNHVMRDVDEELQAHIHDAIDEGRDPAEARRALGPVLRHREASRDVRVVAWLDSLRADAVFGWRQLNKKKRTSAAAILSLALAIGACTAAFRLIDALLLRPLPVAGAERLYSIARQGIDPVGNFRISESSEYPLFSRMRAAVKDKAELIAVSYAGRTDLTYGSDDAMEKAQRQYVSGWMFSTFGLKPAVGRLLTANDDVTPGGHPQAVLSYDYWTQRFAQDPLVIGRTFRMGNDLYEIVGVVGAGFTGTEPGTFVDVFVPAMMNPYVTRSDASWFRPFAILRPGTEVEPIRQQLHAIMHTFDEERTKGWTNQNRAFIDRFLNQTLLMEPASSGMSGMQTGYRRSLIVLGVLVALVLLIACANIANLMTAQASARAREMALRVSIGAGRGRLVQLVLVESAWLAFLAALLGGVFAWRAAPFVLSRINPPDNPARLFLPADWRVFGFGLLLALAVTFLFGLGPALRASSVKPTEALKGGSDPHARRRLMHALIAAQVAFCFLVQFAAGLFVATSDRLASQPTGFNAERILILDTGSRRPQPAAFWNQISEQLKTVPGVEKVALAGWPLLDGNGWNGFIWINGASTEVLSYFLGVSPEWAETMEVSLIDGRKLRPEETYPGVALVNETFAKQCFGGGNPIGKWFEKETGNGVTRDRFQVVGLVRDARYRNMREPITPTAYVPFHYGNARGAATGSFLIRTSSSNPSTMAPILRQEVSKTRPEFRVSNTRTQTEVNLRQTVRERLISMLAIFFALVALLLAGVGLYGILDYSVLQKRREIGIRMAIGATAGNIARRVTAEVFSMVILGAIAGVVLGAVSVRYIEALLYQVKPTELGMLALPSLTIVAVALVAALPAVIRAVRIDPATILRAD